MKCVILAAGEGKRMHPLTYTRPKVMLPLGNKPLLEWNLKNAKKAGLQDFIIIVGYKSNMVREYFEDGEEWGVNITYLNQGKPMGTAHALGLLRHFVDDFLVLNGDTIFGKKDIQQVMKHKWAMGIFEVDNPGSYGVVELKKGKIAQIYEKMKHLQSNCINAGIYRLNKDIFSYIKKTPLSPRGEYEITDTLNLFVQKYSLAAIKLEEWRDVKYPWELLDANREILSNTTMKKRKVKVDQDVTIEGKVDIGQGSNILRGSVIEGPARIGKNCKIGPNCYIRPSTSIGDGCHIGHACEVKNSLIMDHTNISHHNYVGDSVIGQYCNLGSGTKIANLRFDKKPVTFMVNGHHVSPGMKKLGVIMGDGVQTGINSMINVGSVIGNDVYIGPGALATGLIMPHSKIM